MGGSRIALALAGGGPEGAIYEIGALRALEEAIHGLDLNEMDMYIGVSAGAFVGSCLANGISIDVLARGLVRQVPGSENVFNPKVFFTPAFREFVRRGVAIPRLLVDSVLDYAKNPDDKTLLAAFTRIARALPVGIFDNEPLRAFLAKVNSFDGRTDDFRELKSPLVVVAADLDSGLAMRFGYKGNDHIPISLAVQASTALPGLYPPVEVEGRHFVDGVLLKTVHASVALDDGANLVLCVNPIVPVDTVRAVQAGIMRRGRLIDRGLPTVMSQTFRTLIHSRLLTGMAAYEGRYDDGALMLIEPKRDDYRMFFTNIFSFSSRRAVCEHAYQSTRRDLLERFDNLSSRLAMYGLVLDREILEDPTRTLWAGVGVQEDKEQPEALEATDRLESALDRLERVLSF